MNNCFLSWSIAISLALLLPVGARAGLVVGQAKLGNIFLVGEPVRFPLEGTGSRVDWVVQDFSGKTVAEGAVPLAGSASIAPTITQPGHYELSLTEKKGESVADVFQTTFAIVAPVVLSPESPFGTQTHFAQYNSPDLLEVIARGGISHIRDEQYWNMVETSGKYVFPDKLTAYMDAAKRLGITPLISLDWSHPDYDYSAGQFTGPHTENGRLGYANYAQAILARYGDQLPAVEVWNEYNGGTFIQGPATADKGFFYTEMIKKVAEVNRPLFPTVKILAGAVVPISQGFFKSIFDHGAMPYLDVLSIHPYRDHPQGVELEISELIELTKKYNDGQPKPVWATEFSQNVTSAKDRKQAAAYLVQLATMLQIAGVERMYYYLTEEDRLFPFRGLVRATDSPEGKYVPNPAFPAYANLIAQLVGWSPAGRITSGLSTTTYIYKFTKGQETRYVLWAYAPAIVGLESRGDILQTDLMGVSSALKPSGSNLSVVLGENPIFLTGDISNYRDVGNPVVADSLCDFDKTEGSHSWFYGYAELKWDAVYRPENFQEMTWEIGGNDSYRWKTPKSDYPFIGVGNQHPGSDKWAVRRWSSPKLGKIRVEGRAEVDSHSTDGVGLHLFLNGREILSKILLPEQPFDFPVLEISVEPGSKLDVAVTGLRSIESDATNLQVRIVEVPSSGQ